MVVLLGWLGQSPFPVEGEERIRSAAELKELSLEELVDQMVVLVSREYARWTVSSRLLRVAEVVTNPPGN